MVFIVTIIIILLIIWCRECDFNLMIIYENIFMIAIASTILLIIITMIDSNEKCRKVKMEKSWWKEAALDNATTIDEPQATSVSRCCSTKQANGRANATTWRRDTDLTKNAIKPHQKYLKKLENSIGKGEWASKLSIGDGYSVGVGVDVGDEDGEQG